MRTIRLMSTTAAILLLSAGALSAQNNKTDETTPSAPAAQQNAPPEKIAPAAKSDPSKAPEKTGQAVPTAPQSTKKQQTTEKAAPAGDTGKVSSDADRSTDVKSKRTARHVGARYAGGHHGPLYNSYRGDWGYRGCGVHNHRWMPWLWC
jgi:hypothetical protein